MNELLSMRLFLSVVQAGSFSEAGRQLGLEPSSISRQITTLEEGLGTALFTRTTRQLSLTEAGALFQRRVQAIVADVEETRTMVRDLDGTPRGTLRVTAPISLGRLHLAPAVVSFLSKYPDVDVELAFSDRIIDIVADRIDVAIRIGALPDSSLRARRLSKMQRHVYASPKYIQTSGAPLAPADLSAHNCLTFHQSDSGSLWRPGGNVWRLQDP
jgi:DNA-binding transcriptional LysR family regulator